MSNDIYREEFERLPRWARIALAGHCARRVIPLFSLTDLDVYMEHSDSLNRAAMIVELSAAETDTHSSAPEILDAVKEAYLAAKSARTLDIRTHCAADAADTARKAVLATTHPDNVEKARDAVYEARMAAVYTKDYGPDGPLLMTQEAIRRDFDRLLIAARKESWDDDTAVGPEFFEALWPAVKPPGWPNG